MAIQTFHFPHPGQNYLHCIWPFTSVSLALLKDSVQRLRSTQTFRKEVKVSFRIRSGAHWFMEDFVKMFSLRHCILVVLVLLAYSCVSSKGRVVDGRIYFYVFLRVNMTMYVVDTLRMALHALLNLNLKLFHWLTLRTGSVYVVRCQEMMWSQSNSFLELAFARQKPTFSVSSTHVPC